MIQVACRCGNVMNVDELFAGDTVPCTQCKTIVSLAGAPAALESRDDGLDPELLSALNEQAKKAAAKAPAAPTVAARGGPPCPVCRQPLSRDGRYCLACGFQNLDAVYGNWMKSEEKMADVRHEKVVQDTLKKTGMRRMGFWGTGPYLFREFVTWLMRR